ncbi:MAG: hypothetical protein KUG72_08265 [Pseudomonadales bacterium]|nr:hypothetical protein [Pseudomonadales bacterium]MBV1915365.1 hypothetical protein [Pseudomonadales bacterium]
MYIKRENEVELTHERSERFFQADAAWFFTVRGGRCMGPYQTKRDAVWASGDYIRNQSAVAAMASNLIGAELRQ